MSPFAAPVVPPWVPDDPGLGSFRDEVCGFLADAMDPSRIGSAINPRDRTGLTEAFERDLQRAAGARGYLGVSIATEHGGGGRPGDYAATFCYEAAYHDAPLVDTAITLAAGPVIEYGTSEQREWLLPLMHAGEIEMCIAYTEPGAGNDLASLTTTAVRDGDGFVLSGTKSLLTGGDKADYCLTVALTDPDAAPRAAMTMFVVDLALPGVSRVAQPTMAGYDLWEIRFDGVRLDQNCVLGTIGNGWRQLLFAVAAERNSMFMLGSTQRIFDTVLELVTTADSTGSRPIDDPVVADRVLTLWLDLQVAHRFSWSGAAAVSLAKVALTELMQRLADVGTDFAGPAGALAGQLFGGEQPGAAVGGRLAHDYLFRFDGTVSVGTNEIHRAGIARQALGSSRQTTSSLLPAAAGQWPELLEWLQPTWRDGVVVAAPAGQPAGFSSLVDALTELGRANLASPIQNGFVLAAAAVGLTDSDSPHLAAILAGSRRYAVSLGAGLAAQENATGWVLNGRHEFVPDAGSAEVYLVATDDALIAVEAGSPGVTAVEVTTIAGRPQSHLHFEDVAVGADAVIAAGPAVGVALAKALDLARVAMTGEVVGAGEALLQATIDRVKTREQYGAPLSALPAVQLRLADMVSDQAAAADALAAIVDLVDRGGDYGLRAREAQLICSAACGRVAAGAHQLWGGTGYLAATGLAGWTAFIKSAQSAYGTTADNRRELVRRLLADDAWSDHHHHLNSSSYPQESDHRRDD